MELWWSSPIIRNHVNWLVNLDLHIMVFSQQNCGIYMGSYGKVMVNVQPIRSPDHQIMVNMARLDVLCSISHWELAPAIGGHGRNTTGYCPTSPVEEYQHPATGTKPGDRRRRPDSLGLPVLKFRQKNQTITKPIQSSGAFTKAPWQWGPIRICCAVNLHMQMPQCCGDLRPSHRPPRV